MSAINKSKTYAEDIARYAVKTGKSAKTKEDGKHALKMGKRARELANDTRNMANQASTGRKKK